MVGRVRAALEAAVGGKVSGERSVSGGDINSAHAISFTNGRRLFVKTNAREPAGLFQAEAEGLAWLAEARALRVPDVVACGPGFLALELIEAAPRARDFDERLGRGLAALHRFGAPRFGLDHDNFIGRLPQDNARVTEPDWPAFYRARRLEPQLRLATDEGLASARMRSGFERLFARLPELCGPPEPPARLHGDL
ncbi:MAG TPA: fructosamine kinase family protein, partial [Burkholderiales bacterium]